MTTGLAITEIVTASTIVTGIEVNLIYMTYSRLKNAFYLFIYFFCRNSSITSMCYTWLPFEAFPDWGSGETYSLSACQVSYLLRLSLNSERFLYGSSVNEIKGGLLPLDAG